MNDTTSMSTGQLRVLADQANRNLAAAQEKRVQGQVEKLYAAMKPMAARGLYEGTYRDDLCSDAQKQLKAEGLTIRDDGDGVASIYHIKW